jgi:hypothetical protein
MNEWINAPSSEDFRYLTDSATLLLLLISKAAWRVGPSAI